jgi:2-desacetyl-2-hydroxyethyl bacteriochlorophyllide A dehydrogenase
MDASVTSPEKTIDPQHSSEARALWFSGPGQCELRNEPLLLQRTGEVLVRTKFSGISRGTESLVFHGKVPPSEYDRMRCPNISGAFTFPVKYGYAAVGIVEAGDEKLIGRNVFCLHPHQDFFCVPSISVTSLPADLPPERAILAANMETALNVIWDANVLPGDRVAVFGAGVVGTLIAYIASGITGTSTVLTDTNSAREKLASHLDIAFSPPDAIGSDYDVVINASSSGDALISAIGCAGREARIVEASWYGDQSVSLPLGGAFHANRLSIVSSQVGQIPPSRRARWDYARRLAKALDLLADSRLDVLISGESHFADLPTSYADIIQSPATLCHRIRY